MSLKKLITNYAAFNVWANQRIVSWLQGLDEELLYRQTPSSFTSLDYTLQHILRTQIFWRLFITGQDYSHLKWAVREREVANILREILAISEQMETDFGAFEEADLLTELNLDTPWAKNRLPRYEYIVHVVNHSSFHRGQLVTMARQLGIDKDIPNTDYNIYNTQRFNGN